MGIKNLLKFIRDKHPYCYRPLAISALRGQTVAIDGTLTLNRFWFAAQSQRADSAQRLCVQYTNNMLDYLAYHQITPIVVFDGAMRPVAKEKVAHRERAARRARSLELRDAAEIGEEFIRDVMLRHGVENMPGVGVVPAPAQEVAVAAETVVVEQVEGVQPSVEIAATVTAAVDGEGDFTLTVDEVVASTVEPVAANDVRLNSRPTVSAPQPVGMGHPATVTPVVVEDGAPAPFDLRPSVSETAVSPLLTPTVTESAELPPSQPTVLVIDEPGLLQPTVQSVDAEMIMQASVVGEPVPDAPMSLDALNAALERMALDVPGATPVAAAQPPEPVRVPLSPPVPLLSTLANLGTFRSRVAKTLQELDATTEATPEQLNAWVKSLARERTRLDASTRGPDMEVVDTLETLLTARGVPVVYAPSRTEAEQVCGALVHLGHAQWVATEDSDVHVFWPKLPTVHNLYRIDKAPMTLVPPDPFLLEALQLRDLDALIDFAVVCGCDYSGGIRNIGPVKGLALVQQFGSLEKALEANPALRKQCEESFAPEEARAVFKHSLMDLDEVNEVAVFAKERAAASVNAEQEVKILEQFQVRPFDVIAFDEGVASALDAAVSQYGTAVTGIDELVPLPVELRAPASEKPKRKPRVSRKKAAEGVDMDLLAPNEVVVECWPPVETPANS
ncbi:Elongation of fatty acids protein 2 [Allomyces arbusculus]|nr:Elongation of fatty acids protein 2 [Allomyces arbusculus]